MVICYISSGAVVRLGCKLLSLLLLFPIVTVANGLASDTSAETTARWQAVPSLNNSSTRRADRSDQRRQSDTIPYEDNSGHSGDRLYIVEAGDTLSSIAIRHTGSENHAKTIALHNGHQAGAQLIPGNMLLIPAVLITKLDSVAPIRRQHRDTSLLTSSTSADNELPDTASSAEQYRSARVPALESDTAMRNASLNPSVAGPVRQESPRSVDGQVKRANVDMFVGEIRVYRRVGVNRVAIGNGKLLRADVLDTGELLLIAEAEGSTSLRLWHHDNTQTDLNIRVGAKDPATRFHRETMIRFRVKMVEFRKSALTRLGIDWSDSAAGPTFATAGDLVSNPLFRPTAEGFAASLPQQVRPFTSHVGIASSLSSRIDFLASNGDAEVLAEPVLSCANGGSARFLAGGEVPYPTTGSNGQTTVEFKEYGIRLEVSPRVDEFGHIATDVMTEISSIDPAVTVQGAPGLLTRRTQTQVSVANGETIVISGLLKAEASKDIDKLPGIAGLPVLGRLFRSENIRQSLSELVIFITPEISAVASQALSEDDLLTHEESRQRLQAVRQQLDFSLIQ